MEAKDGQKYRVVKSRSRVYRSANTLKSLYSFNLIFLGLSFLISTILTIILLLNFVKQSSGSILQFIAGLGLGFFFSLTLSNLIALLVNIAIIYLLALGVRKDLPVLTGAISILTATAHLLTLAAIGFCLFVISMDSQGVSFLAGFTNSVRELRTSNPGVLVLVIFVQILVIIYSLLFFINGLRGFRETLVETPLSTLFPNGILVESARKDDTESLMKIHYAIRRKVDPEKNSWELWRQRMKKVNLETDVRVARIDETVVGFLITSQNFTKVESVFLAGEATNDVEPCLLRDFARLYSRSNQYVDFIEVSSKDLKLQKALSHNGWEKSKKSSSPRKVAFLYSDSVDA